MNTQNGTPGTSWHQHCSPSMRGRAQVATAAWLSLAAVLSIFLTGGCDTRKDGDLWLTHQENESQRDYTRPIDFEVMETDSQRQRRTARDWTSDRP